MMASSVMQSRCFTMPRRELPWAATRILLPAWQEQKINLMIIMVDCRLSMHVCFDFSYLELGHDDLVPVRQRPLDGQLQGLAARELGVGGSVLV